MEFHVIGFSDVQNPSAISRTYIDKWESEGVIVYCGSTDDIRPYYLDADCVVLPSYRRLPRTLLKRYAMESPLLPLTLLVVGMPEDGITGFVCKPRFQRLGKMEKMIFLSRNRGSYGKSWAALKWNASLMKVSLLINTYSD